MSKSRYQYRSLKHYGLILLLLSIGMQLFISGCGALDTYFPPNLSQSQIKQTSTLLPPTTQKTYVVGDTFKIGDLQYTLNSVRTSNGNANCDKSPKYGKTFLLLDLTIENQGSADAEVRSMIGFKLYDKDGRNQAFSMSAAQAVKCAMDGTITAGGKMTGELGYEVLKGDQTFKLVIFPNPFSSKTALVEIQINGLVFETI
jgi:hypothetical protein